MITKWEDLPGVKKVYWGSSDTVVLVYEDDFAVVSATRDTRNYDGTWSVLAGKGNRDALYDAAQAGAKGAQELLDVVKAKFKKDFEEQERSRLAYLQKKYGGVKC